MEKTEIPVPASFNPRNGAHISKILEKLNATDDGGGWRITSFNEKTRKVTAVRQSTITETTAEDASEQTTFDVRLPSGTKPTDGDRISAELTDTYPGFYMARFEPFLGKATMEKLTDDEARCRGAVSVALGVKPWEVQATSTPDGGFALTLPHSYVGSKHDQKLEEVATTVVGAEGWYVTVDAQKLHATFTPSEPPTFPEVFPTPIERLGQGDIDRVPFARALPQPGEHIGPEVAIDWTDSAWALLAGTPGAGKSVTLNCILADAVSNGSELVIIDDQSKAVDFEPFKPFVRDHGWGCDSLEHAAAALGLVREEGARRAKELKRLGLNNWLDMPAETRFNPILVIFDEVSAVLVPEPPLKGIPKDHPLFLENQRTNVAKALIGSFATKIIAELRFVGVRMIMSTQATNANTGVGPSTRTKMGHFFLQGVNPSKAARNQIFADESSVPTVPDNVKASGKRARGVGVADLGGQAPTVYKTYFATPGEYAARLTELNVPTTTRPAPTAAHINSFLPSLDDEDAEASVRNAKTGHGEKAPSGRPAAAVAAEMGDEIGVATHDGSLGTGFEKANAMRNLAAGGGQTRKQKAAAAEEAEWAARSSNVTVTHTSDDQR